MKALEGNVLLSHGNGGMMMHKLIEEVFLSHFSNEILNRQSDAAVLPGGMERLAFTTDSFVIDPLFFPGGNIGKLAVCGTVNDLAVSGAEPLYISVSMIIEEGFPIADLISVTQSLAEEAKNAGVVIVTGDTKVVQRGKCDKLFINTAGIGKIERKHSYISSPDNIRSGDLILINGTIGDHGIAVMSARESFNFRLKVVSDCASLNHLIKSVLDRTDAVKFMRDPTRGGVATVLNEIASRSGLGIVVDEKALPMNPGVTALCELLGFEPLHIANEGKVIMVVAPEAAGQVLQILKNDPLGRESAIIGEITGKPAGKVVLETSSGGHRIVGSLTGDQFPRIC
jgi:hydrogenase expression/formation protein HypE